MSDSLSESNVFNLEEPEGFFFSYFFDCTMQHARSSFPNQGLNPSPLQQKHGVLTLDDQGSPGPELSLTEKFKICVCVLSLGIEHKVRLLIESIFLVSAYLSFSV